MTRRSILSAAAVFLFASAAFLQAQTAGSPGGGAAGAPAAASGPAYNPGRVPGAGEREMKALARAYPGRVAEAAFRGGEWSVRIDDAWFAWANGRVLPEEDRHRWGEFTGLRFYPYPRGLPPLREFDEKTKLRIAERLAGDEENPPRRSEAFLSRLYRAADRGETEARLVRTRLLGFSVRLHEIAAEKLALVDRDLKILAAAKPMIRRFFSGLRSIDGFNWRPIAGTASRSYHSYGLALDLIPKTWGGLQYYWRNLMRFDDEWYSLPYEKRWMVPPDIVEVFERHGFIWGGKWLYFDTVHFEYRPELLEVRDEKP